MRARPGVLCTHTTRRPGVRIASISAELTSERFHGSCRLRSTTSTIGQPAACLREREPDRVHVERGQPRHRRARRRGEHPRVGAASPLHQHVAGVPCRTALFLQRLVVLVDHHRGGQAGARRPRRRPRSEDHIHPAGGARPVVGHHRDRQPAAAEGGAHHGRPLG